MYRSPSALVRRDPPADRRHAQRAPGRRPRPAQPDQGRPLEHQGTAVSRRCIPLFETFAIDLAGFNDAIAERAVTLGARAYGTARHVARAVAPGRVPAGDHPRPRARAAAGRALRRLPDGRARVARRRREAGRHRHRRPAHPGGHRLRETRLVPARLPRSLGGGQRPSSKASSLARSASSRAWCWGSRERSFCCLGSAARSCSSQRRSVILWVSFLPCRPS